MHQGKSALPLQKGESISKSNSFRWKSFSVLVVFYSCAGLAGMFILPIISVLLIGFMFSGGIVAIGGIIKLIGYLIGVEVPFVMFQIGTFTAPPLLVFVLSVIIGLLMFLLGMGLWKIQMKYIRAVSQIQKKLH